MKKQFACLSDTALTLAERIPCPVSRRLTFVQRSTGATGTFPEQDRKTGRRYWSNRNRCTCRIHGC